MKISRLSSLATLLASLLLLSGCPATLTPETADLQHVHELYATEFTLLDDAITSVGETSTAKKTSSGDAFLQSLRAINDYRARHPDKSLELAHLDVLEGMIFLQSGRFGLARAVAPNVEKAAITLRSANSPRQSATGAASTSRTVRDALFARNFPALLDGWSATRDGTSTPETFETAARAIAKYLGESSSVLNRDHGALYLATSAAVFYAWAQARDSNRVNLDPSDDKLRELEQRRLQRYTAARDLLAGFLTDAERTVRLADELGNEIPRGRLRYAQWYHFFNDALAGR